MAGRVRKTEKKRSVLEDNAALNSAFDQGVSTANKQFSTGRATEQAGMSDLSDGNKERAEQEGAVPLKKGRAKLNRAKRGGSQ